MNSNASRHPFDCLSGPRICIERLAVAFKRAVHGRRLHLRADKAAETPNYFVRGYVYRMTGSDFTFDVAGGRRLAEQDLCFVTFVGAKTIGRKLGRFAQTYWEQAACERIKRPDMTSFRRHKQSLGAL